MNQQELIKAYTSGKVMHNTSRGKKNISTFKFMGKMYGSNTRRNKKYAFDDNGWEIVDTSWWYKFGQVYMDKVKILQDCKKSLNAGVK